LLPLLCITGNKIWSVDRTNTTLLCYSDTLIYPLELISPVDLYSEIETKNVTLSWKLQEGATQYQWQIGTDTNFGNIEYKGLTASTSVPLPALETDTIYYWRVRVIAPVSSPWSLNGSFRTHSNTEVSVPKLSKPEAAASNLPIRPIFQWTSIAGAERYELQVTPDYTFSSILVLKTGDAAIPSNAWRCDIDLEYGTTYYWKVRAVKTGKISNWSAISAFTTEEAIDSVEPVQSTQIVQPYQPTTTPPAVTPEETKTTELVLAATILPPTTVTLLLSSSPSPSTSSSPAEVSDDDSPTLVIVLIAILVILTIILAIVIVITMRRFRKQSH
jgi:hypothetical protein